jgi:calcineurin-like phosphoesterase family protein
MSKVFFTADTHFGHGNIIKYCHRPFLKEIDKKALEESGGKWHDGMWKGEFASRWRMSRDAVDMMNDHLTDQINEVVGVDDTLWHLGDFAFARKDDYYRKCRFYRDRIKCQNVNIIWGNHDTPTCDEPGDDDYVIRDLFNKAHHLQRIKVTGANIILCHYAMAVWNKSHRKNWHLYGHSHSTIESALDRHFEGRRSMDVGVDNAKLVLGEYKPFSMEDLQRIMSKRDGHVVDRHGDQRLKNLGDAPTEEEIMERH